MQRWATKDYVSNGSFTVPAGVSCLFVQGSGGGGGGDTGNATVRAYGGAAAMFSCVAVSVTPNTVISITIGSGGAADANGNDTTFGSSVTFKGGGTSRAINASLDKGSNFLQPFIYRTSTGSNAVDASERRQYGAIGTKGSDSGAPTNMGGLGGSASFAAGGNGHNYQGANGTDAAANSGSGGGGGGKQGTSYTAGTLGGSGRLTVFWLE